MGYLVETSGRILLPEALERQALTVLEVRMGAQQGWFDADDVHLDTVEELAPFAAAQARREGDWLLLDTDVEGDPKWSEQASTFYRTLGSFVREGEVHVRGEDGQVWSYLYSRTGVVQRGDNGWDGTPGDGGPAPAAQSPEPPAPGVAPSPPVPAAPTEPAEFRYPGSEERPEAASPPPPAPTPYAEPSQASGPPHPAYSAGPGQPGVPDYRAESAWADSPPESTGRTLLMATLLVVGVVLIIGLALLVSGF